MDCLTCRTIEQITHYYPYDGVIGDISTNESLQSYKFEGKELDRTFGLDWYDIQARQYDAIGGTWYTIDPLAEKYYGISPYAMCAGNPVNFGDYDGRDIYRMNYNGTIFFYKETNDSFHTIEREYGKNSGQIVATFQTDKYLVEGVAGNANQNRSVLTSDNEKALELFCFLSENSGDSKEWQLNTYSTTEGEVYMLGTTPGKKTVNVSSLEAMNNLSSSDKTNSLHSHPGIAGTIGGSGYDGTYGDKQNIEYWEAQNPGATSPTWFVYHTETRRFYQYDKNNQNLSNDGMTIDEYKKR